MRQIYKNVNCGELTPSTPEPQEDLPLSEQDFFLSQGDFSLSDQKHFAEWPWFAGAYGYFNSGWWNSIPSRRFRVEKLHNAI